MSKMLCALLLAAGSVLAIAPEAQAQARNRIIIPIYQNQSAVNSGSQAQLGGGYGGNTSQTGVLDQSNQQSQTVNVYVPENFQGNIRTRYVGPAERGRGDGRWGRGDDDRGDGRWGRGDDDRGERKRKRDRDDG